MDINKQTKHTLWAEISRSKCTICAEKSTNKTHSLGAENMQNQHPLLGLRCSRQTPTVGVVTRKNKHPLWVVFPSKNQIKLSAPSLGCFGGPIKTIHNYHPRGVVVERGKTKTNETEPCSHGSRLEPPWVTILDRKPKDYLTKYPNKSYVIKVS